MNKKKFLLMIAIIFALIFILYLQTIIELISDWYNDDNYSHGFLIPAISGYLIWQKKDHLSQINAKANLFGMYILIFGLALYLIGTASAEWFSVRISLVLVLFGIIQYFFGKKIINQIWFPILFLFFMIPIPYVIYYAVTFPMQLFSTKITVLLLDLFGLPVTSQGNIINLPNYQLEVVEACSGIRSLMTLAALGAAIAYMTQKTILSGIVVFLCSIPIAIGANVFRIFITAIGAYTISPKFAEGFIHEASGLVVFLVGFLSLGAVAMFTKWFGNMKDYDPLVSG
jgi:exosortase